MLKMTQLVTERLNSHSSDSKVHTPKDVGPGTLHNSASAKPIVSDKKGLTKFLLHNQLHNTF